MEYLHRTFVGGWEEGVGRRGLERYGRLVSFRLPSSEKIGVWKNGVFAVVSHMAKRKYLSCPSFLLGIFLLDGFCEWGVGWGAEWG